MASKVGTLIKEARTKADLTQEKLAKKVGGGLTAGDISKAERGELSLTNAQLKKIATITGVTQASLLNADKPAAKKNSDKKATAKKATEKKATPKTPSNAGITMRVTTTEKKLIEYYRLADSNTKKAATNVLKGESPDLISSIIGGVTGKTTTNAADTVADLLGDAIGNLLGTK